jgi:hypothetical protein
MFLEANYLYSHKNVQPPKRVRRELIKSVLTDPGIAHCSKCEQASCHELSTVEGTRNPISLLFQFVFSEKNPLDAEVNQSIGRLTDCKKYNR